MTDQTIPADLVERLHDLAGKWATSAPFAIEHGAGSTLDQCADELRALLPAPPRPTLADMTPDERDECRGMQADLASGDRVVIIDGHPGLAGRVRVLEASLDAFRPTPQEVTPRPDLPRLEWPGDKKPAPVPALPDGWRLADHRKYGRVIVTNPNQESDGYSYCIFSSDMDSAGFDWYPCAPDALTYLDQEADTADTVPESTLAVGSVIESADDPRIAALPVGSILLDREGDTTTKQIASWAGIGYTPIPSEGETCGPWTVLYIPKEADQ